MDWQTASREAYRWAETALTTQVSLASLLFFLAALFVAVRLARAATRLALWPFRLLAGVSGLALRPSPFLGMVLGCALFTVGATLVGTSISLAMPQDSDRMAYYTPPPVPAGLPGGLGIGLIGVGVYTLVVAGIQWSYQKS